MKISVLQTDIKYADPGYNLDRVTRLIRQAEPSDLFVLPEMFSTGFITDREYANASSGVELEWMKDLAAEKNAAIAGSVFVKERGDFYNRFYFVKPDGDTTYYDKRHLFSYSGEDKLMTRGTGRVIVEYGGMRILLQICYDLRFPVFSRNRDDYDLIIYVANWPASRMEAWNTLLPARAVENLSYVIGVNRVGVDPYGTYPGQSKVFDYKGKVLRDCGENHENVTTFEPDFESLKHFRRKYFFLLDADDFIILY
ncbi:MAG: nitrilase family protein [Rikenellaceae bacterium]|nr:nitrilase family protein [Rikenellaceae bacterium]